MSMAKRLEDLKEAQGMEAQRKEDEQKRQDEEKKDLWWEHLRSMVRGMIPIIEAFCLAKGMDVDSLEISMEGLKVFRWQQTTFLIVGEGEGIPERLYINNPHPQTTYKQCPPGIYIASYKCIGRGDNRLDHALRVDDLQPEVLAQSIFDLPQIAQDHLLFILFGPCHFVSWKEALMYTS